MCSVSGGAGRRGSSGLPEEEEEKEATTDVISCNGLSTDKTTKEATTMMTVMQFSPAEKEAMKWTANSLTEATSTVTTTTSSLASSPEVRDDDDLGTMPVFFDCPQTEPLDLTNYGARSRGREVKRPQDVTTTVMTLSPQQHQVKAAEALAAAKVGTLSAPPYHWKKRMVARYYEETDNPAGALDLSVKNRRRPEE